MKLFIKTIPKALNILAILTMACLGLKIFYFNNIPEAFDGGYEVGVIIEGLLASIIASYIFYLIVVHLKETKDKHIIYPHVQQWANIVVSTCTSQLADMCKATGVQLDLNTITKVQIDQAMNALNPHSQSPLLINLPQNYANWLQYLIHNIQKSRSYITKIMSQIIYIDSTLVALVTSIEECSYFNVLNQVYRHPMKNTNMSFVSNNFFDYCQKCAELKRYIEEMGLLQKR